jgi:hypothetical protein
MYHIAKSMHDRLMRGEQPTPYVVVETHLGYRAYAAKELTEVFDVLGLIADGSVMADGSHTAGSESAGVLEKSARVLDFGAFERTLQPRTADVMAAYNMKQKQHMTIQFDNADRYFSRLIAKEPFIGRPMWSYVGFETDPQSEHLRIFAGRISEISALPVMTVEADER